MNTNALVDMDVNVQDLAKYIEVRPQVLDELMDLARSTSNADLMQVLEDIRSRCGNDIFAYMQDATMDPLERLIQEESESDELKMLIETQFEDEDVLCPKQVFFGEVAEAMPVEEPSAEECAIFDDMKKKHALAMAKKFKGEKVVPLYR